MNLNKVKESIKELIGKSVNVLVYMGRNKEEQFVGVITGMYPQVFTIKSGELTKSFSYSDVMTKHVIIKRI